MKKVGTVGIAGIITNFSDTSSPILPIGTVKNKNILLKWI
jgi:hypothetical protein